MGGGRGRWIVDAAVVNVDEETARRICYSNKRVKKDQSPTSWLQCDSGEAEKKEADEVNE